MKELHCRKMHTSARILALLALLIPSPTANSADSLQPVSFAQSLVSKFSDCDFVVFGSETHDPIIHASVSLQSESPAYSISKDVAGNKMNLFLEARVRKHRRHCVCHFVNLKDEMELINYQDSLRRISAHYPVPLVQVAKDLFFILVKDETLHNFQKSQFSFLPLKLRNKIFGVYDSDSEAFTLFHPCVFCPKKDDSRAIVFKKLSSKTFQSLLSDTRTKVSSFLFPKYCRNMFGAVLRASVPSAVVARVSLEKLDNGEYKPIRGMQLDLLHVISGHLNVTFRIRPSTRGGTGLHVGNGTWEGVVGDIYHDRADVGTGVGISSVRSVVIDFVGYYEYISLVFVYGPTGKIYSWKSVFWPLHSSAWKFLLGCFCITFTVLLCLKIIGDRCLHTKSVLDHMAPAENNVSSMEYFMYLVVTLLGQPADIGVNDRGKLLLVFWLFFCIVMNTAYSSKLFAFLAFPTYERAPQSFEELANSDYEVGLRYIGGAGYNSFKTSNSPALQKIFQRMDLVKDPLECFRSALNRKFCCIAYELQYEYSVKKDLGDIHGRSSLQMAPDRVFFVSVGLGVQKNSIFAPEVDRSIAIPFSMGLVKKWSDDDMFSLHKNKVEEDRRNNIQGYVLETDKRPTPLALSNFIGAYTLLLVGGIVAMVMLGLEVGPRAMASGIDVNDGDKPMVMLGKRITLRKFKSYQNTLDL